MRTTTMVLAASLAAAAGLAAGCGEKEAGGTSGAAATPTAAPAESATAAASAKPAESAAPTAGSAAAASGSAEELPLPAPAAPGASGATGAASAAAPHASGSAAAGGKTFDCGAKGQKPCPMQGWMKTVMASATSSGDGPKLAQALDYVAGRVPPGYGSWAQIAKGGAAKARAGDIEGAKESCKTCHDTYKEKYKATLRDRPF